MLTNKTWRFLAVNILFSWALTVQATALLLGPEAKIKPNYPEEYIVREGDTLWAIAELFLAQPWEELAEWMREPPGVYPGDSVSLTGIDKQKMLQIKHKREVKLSPGIRVPRTERVPFIIPYGSIQQFLTHPRLIEAGELDNASYIVANSENRLLVSAGSRVYARGLDEFSDQRRYQIVRPGQAYHEEGNDEVLAYEAEYLGEAELVDRDESEGKEKELASLDVITAKRSIKSGDLLFPSLMRTFEEDFTPRAVYPLEKGELIAVVEGVSQIGQYQVVVVNKGEKDNVEIGHLLGVYRGGKQIEDKINPRWRGETLILPREKIGTLLVFQVFENISYALVVSATNAIHLYDKVDAP